MRNSIKVITLEGCEVCKSLIKSLQYRGVDCSIVSAEASGDLCDNIEDLLSTNKYPIAVLNENHYFFLTYNSDRLGTRGLKNGSKATGCASIDSMLEHITYKH